MERLFKETEIWLCVLVSGMGRIFPDFQRKRVLTILSEDRRTFTLPKGRVQTGLVEIK